MSEKFTLEKFRSLSLKEKDEFMVQLFEYDPEGAIKAFENYFSKLDDPISKKIAENPTQWAYQVMLGVKDGSI